MTRAQESGARIARLRALMAEAGLSRLVLFRHANLAWAGAGGRSYVNSSTDRGDGWLVIGPDDLALVTSNNEAARLPAEEFGGLPWRVVDYPWWEGPGTALEKLLPDHGAVGADLPTPLLPGARDVSGDIAALRWRHDATDARQARSLGRTVGQVLEEVARAIQPGETEAEIAGRLAGGLIARGADVPVVLVGVDERLYQWRHFLPTGRRLERYACLVVCARQNGLILSATRLVHFGPPDGEILRRVAAVQQIDARLIAATRPGATAGSLFEVARSAYAEAGFPEEWRNHHQGGLAGFEPREWTAAPGATQPVELGQIYAWNPTLPGAKCEDSILVTPEGHEILTASDSFPTAEIATPAGIISRPGILIR